VTEQPLGAVLDGLAIVPRNGAAGCVARRVVEDSRLVKPGDVFLARCGQAVDGHAFIAAAEAAGAAAILSDERGCSLAAGPSLQSEHPAHDGAILAHRLAGDPSRFMSVIGVTGTNGKTTVSSVLAHVLAPHGGCGLLGGVRRDDGATQQATCLTTPMASEVALWLSASRANGCSRAVMEVSSHALAQQRVAGVHFSAAIFTNLSGDHIDYHGSMEEYARCKRVLFTGVDQNAFAIINADDAASDAMVSGTKASVIGCSLNRAGDVRGEIMGLTASGSRTRLSSPWGERVVSVPLVGGHNVMNVLQVVAAACALGADFDDVCDRLSTANAPPGRLEAISSSPHVYVDFAHTDGALKAVLNSLREVKTTAALLTVVVGCGGDRDHTKRPRMAAIASALADRVWLTSDNPRSEDPDAILADMLAGVDPHAHAKVRVEPDRRQAIVDAIAAAGPSDIVLIAGKGHECVQLIGSKTIPFDDRLVAAEALRAAGWMT
jgi:UDP-N-acetylmuramoyl-L-alanyl-D-glutamate--2,6-diaminopimelate ligase